MAISPVTNHLLEYLHEDPVPGPLANPATMLQQGERAQAWLLGSYLPAWLEIIGGLPDAGYPRAFVRGRRLQRIAREAEAFRDERTKTELVFFLESLQHLLRGACADVNKPDERSMQWGVWAREVPMAIVYGFAETGILDPVVCEALAPCSSYAAFLVSMIVEDEGVAEEIEERMFEVLPRELLDLVAQTPAAPEA
jgi:hypothetical protein